MSKLQNIVLYQPKQSLTKKFISQEILQGLKKPQKSFPMKYVYDQVGSKLFEELQKEQSYYLFSSDKEIIQDSCQEMLEIIGKEKFNLVDLGAGDGVKTKIILQKAVQKGYNVHYVPIDISKDANDDLIQRTAKCFPNLDITAVTAFFEDGIRWVQNNNPEKNAYFFLGSTLGGYNKDTLHQFAQFLKYSLKKGDLLFITADIHKDPKIHQAAYKNKTGYATLQYFLEAINKKTDCNFVVSNFHGDIHFQPIQRAIQGNLISKINQNITLCNETVLFIQGEVIKCMVSKKFLISQIQQAFELAEMKKVKIFKDKKEYMINYICERK